MSNGDSDDVLKLLRPPALVRQLAADALRTAIVTGALLPGQRLVEASLAKRMGISRPSIREALSQLAAEKIVTVTPNRGPTVATITWAQAQQIYELRAVLEAEVATRCVANASEDDIGRMRRALDGFRSELPAYDVNALVGATARLYAAMLEACGNAIIAEVIDGLMARISFLRAKSMSDRARGHRSLDELTAIVDAIEARDEESARRAGTVHVLNAMAAARAALNELPT